MSSLATSLQDAGTIATPFADRLRRAQDEMARQGIDLLIVGASADLRYLIGYEGHESERMSVLVLPRDGEPHYVVPGLEAPTMSRSMPCRAISSCARRKRSANGVAVVPASWRLVAREDMKTVLLRGGNRPGEIRF
jgi:Xaa-Pro aminopeptidase